MNTFDMFIQCDEYESNFIDRDCWNDFYDAAIDDDAPDEYYE